MARVACFHLLLLQASQFQCQSAIPFRPHLLYLRIFRPAAVATGTCTECTLLQGPFVLSFYPVDI